MNIEIILPEAIVSQEANSSNAKLARVSGKEEPTSTGLATRVSSEENKVESKLSWQQKAKETSLPSDQDLTVGSLNKTSPIKKMRLPRSGTIVAINSLGSSEVCKDI